MDISNQLRLILLLTGVVIFIAVYFFGRRRTVDAEVTHDEWTTTVQPTGEPEFSIDDSPLIDEETLEVPAYIRKQQQEGRYDAEDSFTSSILDDDHVVDEIVATQAFIDSVEREQEFNEPAITPARANRFHVEEVQLDLAQDEPFIDSALSTDIELSASQQEDHHSASVDFDFNEPNPFVIEEVDNPVDEDTTEGLGEEFSEEVYADPSPEFSTTELQQVVSEISQVPTLSEPVVAPSMPTALTTTIEPVVPPVEKTVEKPADQTVKKPSGQSVPRKIFAVRLAFAQRLDGLRLLELLEVERLTHGKLGIFHRLHEGLSVFSLASMVEPGSFDLQQMPEQYFPGVTFFMLLPGPLDGLIAFDQMMTCAQRIAHATQGVIQDERGNKLNVDLMNRLRDDVLDFQHLIGGIAH